MVELRQKAIQMAKCALAKKDFFYYCQLKASDFYMPERAYLETICNELQNFLISDEKALVLNIPPRLSPWKIKNRWLSCRVAFR